MTDQELVLAALRQVGLIVAEHLELGVTDADEAITQLVAVLDTAELGDAINRLERGFAGDKVIAIRRDHGHTPTNIWRQVGMSQRSTYR
jgi:hypothetical protein